MKERPAHNVKVSAFVFVFLVTVIVSAACAAPPPLVVDSHPASFAEEPQVWVLPENASGETIATTVREILFPMANDNAQPSSIGDLDEIRMNYDNRKSLTTGGAFIYPTYLEIGNEALIEALTPHLFGRVGVSCVESDNQAFWIMDKATVNNLLSELDPSSELWESVASCGEVCEKCGCIGPMSGPTCPTTLMSLEPELGTVPD